MLVVELGGPTTFARIGVMRGLNRHHVRGSIRRARITTGESASIKRDQ
jgi:hypothetical protein